MNNKCFNTAVKKLLYLNNAIAVVYANHHVGNRCGWYILLLVFVPNLKFTVVCIPGRYLKSYTSSIYLGIQLPC